MLNIAFLVSGNGSNLQFIIDSIKQKKISIQVSCVIADRNCFAIQRACTASIPSHIIQRGKQLSSQILDTLKQYKEINLIVMAGFLSIVNTEFCTVWKDKVINIHPSLLPKYGGVGMWGMHVHRAVLASKEVESGCTIHYVTEGVDQGKIILQSRCFMDSNDTVDSLQTKVQALEKEALLTVLQRLS